MSEQSVESLLQRNNELLEILVKLQLKTELTNVLSDPDSKKLYDLTGTKSISEISKALGVSAGKISGIWKRWEQQGLLIKEGRSYKRVI
ncbi:MAG: hypothetical protein AAFY56_16525 [Pseudomonadota bacterium]